MHPRLYTPFFSLLAAAAIAAGTVDCGCTEVGCAAGFQLDLDSTWSEGQYTIEVDAGDGAPSGCTVVVDPRAATVELQKVVTCNGSTWGYFETPERLALSLPSEDRVKVRVLFGEEEVLSEELEPEYEEFKPNGAFCGPTCRSANASLSF